MTADGGGRHRWPVVWLTTFAATPSADINAAQHLKLLTKKRPELLGLRVMIASGGCSGFQYVLRPETRMNEDDQYGPRGRAQTCPPMPNSLLSQSCPVHQPLGMTQGL